MSRARGNRRSLLLVSILSLWVGVLLAMATAYGHEEQLPVRPPAARPPGPTLATVNGVPVTFRDTRDVPLEELLSLSPKEILRKAIHRELLRQEAIRLGFDKDPPLTERLNWFRVPFVKDAFNKWELARLGEVSESDIRQYYEAHKEEFTSKERVIASSHILLKSRKAAEAVLAELKAGADFAALAHELSEDRATRNEGGRLRSFSRGQVTPEFEEAAFTLKPGKLSGVVKDKAGFHIIKVHERIAATLKPFEVVKRSIKDRLLKERLKTRFQALYAEAERKGLIKYKEEAIQKLMAPPPDNLTPEAVLATVNGTPVTVQDFGHIFLKMDRPIKEAARKDPKPFIRGLILEELRYQEGLILGLDQDPGFVQLLEQRKREYLVGKVVDLLLPKVTAVPEEAVRQYYEAHKEEFTEPEGLLVSHNLLKSRKAAEAVLAELKAGADFAKAAQERSEDQPTKFKGGQFFARRGQTTPEFEAVAFALKPGELSGVVEDRAGFHIIKVHEHRPARLKRFEDVTELLQRKLNAEAWKTIFEQHLAELEKRATIEVNEAELAKLKTPVLGDPRPLKSQ